VDPLADVDEVVKVLDARVDVSLPRHAKHVDEALPRFVILVTPVSWSLRRM
jgi:hypothetical protein